MNNRIAKQLRQKAHEQAQDFIGRPKYLMHVKGQWVPVFLNRFMPMIWFKGKKHFGMSTIKKQGVAVEYKKLKRAYKQAKSPAERRAILNGWTPIF
jgi:hypothetical protein